MDSDSPSDRQVRALRVLFESRGISFDDVEMHHVARLAFTLADIREEIAREKQATEQGKAA